MSAATRYRLYILGALYSAPYLAMIIWSAFNAAYKLRSVLALAATAVLVSLLLAGCTRTWRRFFLVAFPCVVASVAYTAYSIGFGIVPGHTLGIVLMSASFEEVRGLWTLWQSKWLVLPAVGSLLAYLWLAYHLPKQPIFAGRVNLGARVLLFLSLPPLAYAAHSAPQLVDGLAVNPVTGSLMFVAGQLPRARAEIHGAGVHKVPFNARRITAGEEVHVLIVGESARRASWSLYGYPRQTTPYLDKIREELVVMQHAMADANLTSHAVPMILTGVAPRDFGPAALRGNLFDLAKEAGYSTAWLVNQDLDVTTSIGITPDRLEFPPDPQAGLFGRHLFDDVLLPTYQRELARGGSARFIGIHIMESHWEYFRRYPPSFQHFGDTKDLNLGSLFFTGGNIERDLTDSYDNSVLYTDWFMQQVIEAARKLNIPAAVTFIPDHGESLPGLDAGMAGHGGPVYSASQYEIPAFIWVNDAFRAAHPRQLAALRSNATKEVRSHDFFYTVADLMGISWPENNPERSIASETFAPDLSRQELVGGVLALRP